MGHEVGIVVFGNRGKVPARKGCIAAPHDLDVLLRHRLFRKTGGFEGFAAIGEYLSSGRNALMKRVDGPPAALHFGLAP